MSAFEVAKEFFEACDKPLGWEGCKEYVAEGAPFTAQSDKIAPAFMPSPPAKHHGTDNSCRCRSRR